MCSEQWKQEHQVIIETCNYHMIGTPLLAGVGWNVFYDPMLNQIAINVFRMMITGLTLENVWLKCV